MQNSELFRDLRTGPDYGPSQNQTQFMARLCQVLLLNLVPQIQLRGYETLTRRIIRTYH